MMTVRHEVTFAVRFTLKEASRLENLATLTGRTRSEVLRTLVNAAIYGGPDVLLNAKRLEGRGDDDASK